MSEEKKNAQAAEKPGKSRWYKIARAAAAVLFHTLGPVRYHHAKRLPQEGPCILIGNHTSFIDPVLMAARIKPKEVTFLGKKELVGSKLGRHVLTDMHMIIVDRHNSDMEAMRACSRALRAGEILGIFPEGTRHHKGLMKELESGAALIALRANVPLVPVYITPKYRLFHMTHVYVGKPIDFADLRSDGVNMDSCKKLLERITETYAHMASEPEA